jgi:hypothetical protein
VKVSTTEPFQIIYSLFEHEFLGYLFESFVVQIDAQNRLSFKHQNISFKNAQEFHTGLDDIDYQLIKLIDAIQQDAVVKKFSNKKTTTAEFFTKVFHKEKGDSLLQEAIASYIEIKKNEILNLLGNRMIFEMGHDGEPTWKRLSIAKNPASVLFHFMRNEENTHYFPTIKHDGEKIDFQYKNAIIVCNQPAWLLVNNTIYHFSKDVDGNKLKPFLNKKFILVPRKVEDTYYERFVTPLIASFDVYAKGFEIKNENFDPKPILTITELQQARTSMTLFGEETTVVEEDAALDVLVNLEFQYGAYTFPSTSLSPSFVKLEKTKDSYLFHKVKRDQAQERTYLFFLQNSDLQFKGGKISLPKALVFKWLSHTRSELERMGFQINQSLKDGKRYFMGESKISLQVKENNDWFDIYAIVTFGSFEIPFLTLKQHILKGRREFLLPNGETAIIPEEWFSQYTELFAFMEHNDGEFMLQKHHLNLVKELKEDRLATVTMSNKLEQLHNFEEITDYPLPIGFNGTLRPYQKAGYNWMRFLNEYKFGGCLADDMGLGKTIQTLTLLQSQYEQQENAPSLLVMPTSLVYNWIVEAKKFTPSLKVLNYTGNQRQKSVESFTKYDVVITSYGILRIDLELFKKLKFHYIILDESQVNINRYTN